MIPDVPWYITLTVLAIDLAVAVALWRILSTAAARAGLPPSAQRNLGIGTALFFAAWYGAALLLAPAPASVLTRNPFYVTPLIPLFAILPPTIVLLAIWLAPALRRVLASVSLPALIGVQVYRVIGAVFLVLLAQGQLPSHFALPAGWGDIAIGLAAPLVAIALARGIRGGPALAIAWNVVGLLDLAVAVGMGTGLLAPLLAPEMGGRLPAAAAMGIFPMILVPAFVVPISVMLHLLALSRLRKRVRMEPGVNLDALQAG
jgi:hypothetical protein